MTHYQRSHHVHMGPLGNRESERYTRELAEADEERGLRDAERAAQRQREVLEEARQIVSESRRQAKRDC